jgi:BolA protein
MITDKIKQKITRSLNPEQIEIIDNSHAHAGHAGAQNGGGHFQIKIVASGFEGKTLVQRHQLVYQALGEMMTQEIHALGIDATTPNEAIERT